MQELCTSECTCRDEAGTTHTFQYILLAEDTVYEQETYRDYGIMIRSSATEQVCVPHITTDYDRIIALLMLLKTHKVSPTHLHDVIADWL